MGLQSLDLTIVVHTLVCFFFIYDLLILHFLCYVLYSKQVCRQ